MAAIVNDRDVLLQVASVRKLTTVGAAVIPTASSSNFYVRADGMHGPDTIRITAGAILCDGPFTFSVQGAKLGNVTDTTADIAFGDMTSSLAIVTVTAANGGAPVQGACIIGVVSDGVPGQSGARGTGVYYATGNAWSDSVAKAAGPGGTVIVGDVVTISNGTTYALTKKYDGSAWVPLGGVYDGSLFVTGSIQAAAINANGLVLRDLQGRPILGAGTALADSYVPNSVVTGINNAALSAVWSSVTGSGKPQDGATVGANASNFTGVVGGDNLCPNSSFEVASDGKMPDGWGIYNNQHADGSSDPAASSIEVGRSFGKAVAISWSVKNDTTKGIYRYGAVPNGWIPGATYVVSFYAKTSNLSSVCQMFLGWNIGPVTAVELSNPNLSTAWQRYAFKITWGGATEPGGRVYVSLTNTPYPGNVYFDDFMIVEGDVLPAYYPSATEALTTANAAVAAIAAISSDNVLSRGEKPAVQQAWGVIYDERGLLQTQAGNLGVDSSAYRAKYNALEAYLVSLGAGFNDNTIDTPIDGALFKTRFSEYYLAKMALQNAMDAANKSAADNAQATANSAMQAIANISSDNVLSKGEKSEVVIRWQACDADKAALVPQAAAVGVDSTAYVAAHKALSDYLVGIPNGWNNANYDSAIDPTVWNAKWNAYYSEKSRLIAALNNGVFVPPSKGMALNEDPAIEKPGAWKLTGNTTISTGAGGSGSTGDKFFRSQAWSLDSLAYGVKGCAIDFNKTYVLSAALYQDGYNDRAMWVFVDFYDAAGNWIPGNGTGGTGWGGGHSGYTYGGIPPANTWTRCGGQFGANVPGRAIPSNARTAVVGVWFNYSGSGSTTNAVQGAQDIRLEPVIGMTHIDPSFAATLSDKLSKTSASALAATVTLATNGSLLAGTTSNGVFMNPSGLYGVQNGVVKFSVPTSGDPAFAGTVYAAAGSIGGLTLSNSALCSGGYSGWAWPTAKDSNGSYLTGTYFGPTGILLGNQYNNRYFQVTYEGNIYAPGLQLENSVLTLTNPVIVTPKISTTFSANVAGLNLTHQNNGQKVTTTIGVALSNGSGNYAYQWSFSPDAGPGGISALGSLTNAGLTITAQGSNVVFFASCAVTVRDLNTGMTASAGASLSIQFGSGVAN